MRLQLVIAFGLTVAATTACLADEKSCLTAAFQDYLKASQALLTQGALGIGLNVETIVAKRRLEEQFCLRTAGCRVGPNQPWVAKTTPDMAKLALAAEFGRCLDDEAEENLKNRVK
jgi:hypothetical protein